MKQNLVKIRHIYLYMNEIIKNNIVIIIIIKWRKQESKLRNKYGILDKTHALHTTHYVYSKIYL